MLQIAAILWKHLAVIIVTVLLNIAYWVGLLTLQEFRISAGLVVIWTLARYASLFAPLLRTLFLGKRRR
ncbi:hypothetical protein EAH73_11795 [Hymenobacter nivis]|uniref:Uncharacterized protein n=1 Tax=Hymenobacter nivis TaxID=1850093 RepID=A0A502GWW4_9BACT|nr:hypothetical protein EAH73_11795 [Hymenobacter nivis]